MVASWRQPEGFGRAGQRLAGAAEARSVGRLERLPEVIRAVIVRCSNCEHEIQFDQPYAYHAGFGNQGFLYDDAGTCTLVWSSFDLAYVALVGECHPWALNSEQQELVEDRLKRAPGGGAWRFSNPPRCPSCSEPIGEPIGNSIHYYLYPDSVLLDQRPSQRSFADALSAEASRPTRACS